MADRNRSAVPAARGIRVAFGVGLALLVGALAVVLSGSPLRVIGTNSVADQVRAAGMSGFHTCQATRRIPKGTTAIRISAGANTGPRITLAVFSKGRLVTSGRRPAGWGVDENVTVGVKRVPRTITDAKVCITFGPVIELIQLNGTFGQRALPGAKRPQILLLRFEYLRRGGGPWWSLASSIATRMGYEHVPSGTWVVFLLLALTIAMIALALRLAFRELL